MMWFDKKREALIVDQNSKNTPILDWITVGFNDFKKSYENKINKLQKEINLIKKTTIQKKYHLYYPDGDIWDNCWNREQLKSFGYEFQEYLKEQEAELWIKEDKEPLKAEFGSKAEVRSDLISTKEKK